MKLLALLIGAIFLIILGARGTYKAVWNSYFPNEPIVTTPVSATPNATTPNSSGPYIIPAQPNSVANPSNTPPKVTPNVTSTGGSTKGQKVTVITGGGAYPVESIGTTKQAVISTGNPPSWWPSWLPAPSWLLQGQGQTGQVVNNRWAP